MDMQNLFVIFPPGAGGNHLSNLIALSNQYDRCVDYTKYDSISGPAHFANHQNLAPCQTFFQDIQNQNNVLCCHLAQYLWCQDLVRQYLPNRKYLIVDLYQCSDAVRQRMNKSFFPYQHDYMWHECSTLYSSDYFSRLTGETDYFYTNVGLIVNEDVEPLLQHLYHEVGVSIDQEQAQHIHKKWFDFHFRGANK